MKYKKSIIIIMLAMFIFSIAAVSASDVNDTVIASGDTGQMELSTSDEITDTLNVNNNEEKLTSGNIWYVNSSAANGEGTLDNPFNNLKDTITASSDNDIIRIASGTYAGENNTNLIIDKNLTLERYGDGEAVFDGSGSYGIWEIQAKSINMTGFTFQNGYGGNGGALLFKSELINSNINANFNNNYACSSGGAIYFAESLTNVNITGNFTKNNAHGTSYDGDGGGAICFFGELNHVNIIGNFTDNIAQSYAGANYFKSKITNVNIFGNYNNNTATGQNGGANWFSALLNVNIIGNYSNNKANTGGANVFYEALKNVNITGNYKNNTATFSNGGANQFSVGLINVAITGDYSYNKAENGGANYFYDVLNNVNITGNYCHNEAGGDGGANRLGNPSLVNIIGNYTNNTAKSTGSWSGGGAIYVSNTPTELNIEANFYNNTAVSQGAAILFYNSMSNVDVTGNFINNKGKSVIYNWGTSNSIIHDSIFINNSKINVDGSGTIKIVDTWFGNNATNYNIAPSELKIDFENWLFLNATANPNTIHVSGSSDISFKLYAYNKDTGEVSNYDNSLQKPINLTVTTTNGVVDKKIIKLGDSVKYTPSSVGTGNVTAHASVNYLGETRVFDENANVLLNIEKSNPVLIINDITFDYNSTGSTVLYYEGASGVVANVINQPNAVISIGYNRITVSNLDAGQYTLSVTTISATGYDAITEYCRITVNQIDSDLSLDDVILDWGKSVNITVNTNGTTGITAKINNQTVNVTNYTIPISDLDAGLYTLSVTTIADANHNPVTKEANVTVNKVDSVISLNDVELDYGSSVNVTVAAEGAVGITALIDNESVEVNNFTILISGLNVGSHVLTVTSVADANHNPVNKTVKVTVNKLNSELTATEITTTYNVNKNIVVTLTDINGNPIGGVNVTVYLNGEKTFTTDSNGQINVSTGSLAPKTYTASITFNGTDIYAKSAKDVNVTVKKATPKITAKNKTFKTTTKTKKYTITLKDNVGKVIKNAKVTLKVKGVTYKATTNSKGKATFKITKLGKKGTYKATVTYKGNSYYNKATKKVKITVKKPFKTVSSGSKDTSTVKKIQRALKSNGYYLKADGKTLKVDGKYDKYTVSAVKEFQKDNALKVTGKVDEKTAKKLKII